jgi:hypothetical protein
LAFAAGAHTRLFALVRRAQMPFFSVFRINPGRDPSPEVVRLAGLEAGAAC